MLSTGLHFASESTPNPTVPNVMLAGAPRRAGPRR